MTDVRKSWTDERLDDFRDEVNRRFDEVDRRIDSGFNRVDAELQAFNARFDAFQRTLFQFGTAMIVALIGLIATQI
jgi:hypothetical protein